MNGMQVDTDELQRVKQEFEKEKIEIENNLQMQVRELMGDTPINLNSPEQLSQLIYSRIVIDKKYGAKNCLSTQRLILILEIA